VLKKSVTRCFIKPAIQLSNTRWNKLKSESIRIILLETDEQFRHSPIHTEPQPTLLAYILTFRSALPLPPPNRILYLETAKTNRIAFPVIRTEKDN
jgi:hypothetical protein